MIKKKIVIAVVSWLVVMILITWVIIPVSLRLGVPSDWKAGIWVLGFLFWHQWFFRCYWGKKENKPNSNDDKIRKNSNCAGSL